MVEAFDNEAIMFEMHQGEPIARRVPFGKKFTADVLSTISPVISI